MTDLTGEQVNQLRSLAGLGYIGAYRGHDQMIEALTKKGLIEVNERSECPCGHHFNLTEEGEAVVGQLETENP
jgi:hypothetical protein